MLPLSWCRHRRGGKREEWGRKEGKNHVQWEKKFCPNIVINFCVCVHRDVGGCRVRVCENIGAELELEGKCLMVSQRGELEEARVVLQRHKESPQSTTFLQRPPTWVWLYKSATITDLRVLYIHFLWQNLAWDAPGQFVSDTCLILLNWKMLDPRSHGFSFVFHSSVHTWCILVCTQQW